MFKINRNRALMLAAAVGAVALYFSINSKGSKASCGCGKN